MHRACFQSLAGLALAVSCSLPWALSLGTAAEPPVSAQFAIPPIPVLPPASPAASLDPARVLLGPVLTDGQASAVLPPARLESTDRPLPINLATALRLAGARPIVIAEAQASVQVAVEQLAKARLEWLPSLNAGAGYYHHDGATQGQSGTFYINTKDQFLAGGGMSIRVATTDALFDPLAARQLLRSRQIDVQTAQNDAMLSTAEAYFRVQEARGRLVANQDLLERGVALARAIDLSSLVDSRPADLHRARALRAAYEQAIATAREDWRVASDDLTQVLRLDPTATVEPMEPPDLRVTLISPKESLDQLIPIGLTSRPELASQQALVQAALARIRQERMRPLIPSLILEGSPGSAGPGGYMMGGVFASGAAGAGNPSMGRDDVSMGLVWQLDNLGFGNRALVRERRAEQQQQVLALFRLQDKVAAEIARAYAQLESATTRIGQAEFGLREARLAYEGSIQNLGKTERLGLTEVQVRRTFEVIDALKALADALERYFASINDYNRAQFRLYRALGTPAGILACDRPAGPVLPVDTSRPSPLPPVCAPDACRRLP